MKLVFLGTMSALVMCEGKFQSNMLIESKSGEKILIDCGTDIRHSLHAQGYHYTDVGSIYISHLHADHVGGLEWFAFSKYFLEKRKPALYISPDQRNRLWNNVLSGGMQTLEEEEASLETFFDIKPIDENCFIWDHHLFQLIKTHHISSNHNIVPSYGLLISGDQHKIFISTDTTLDRGSLDLIYEKADLIFNDCETGSIVSGQHAHYDQLKLLNPNIKQKMWLYHYNGLHNLDPKKDGFRGFVTQGDQFTF